MINIITDIEEHINPYKPIAYSTYQQHINRYIFVAQFIKGKIVLDIGCGSGLGAKYWIDKGAKSVTGIDTDNNAIEEAKSWSRKARFMVIDAQAMPFPDNSFDTMVALEVIEHLEDANAFLIECQKILKTEGILICSTPNRQVVSPLLKKPRNPHHIKEFNPQEFSTLIDSHFSNTKHYGQKILSLKDRIKPTLIAIVDNTITNIFGKNGLRDLLLKVGKPILAQPHYPQFNDDFEGNADKDLSLIHI